MNECLDACSSCSLQGSPLRFIISSGKLRDLSQVSRLLFPLGPPSFREASPIWPPLGLACLDFSVFARGWRAALYYFVCHCRVNQD